MNSEYLKSAGLNVEEVLEFWGNIDAYSENLIEFLNTIDTRINELKSYKDNKEISSYTMLCHSLKSDEVLKAISPELKDLGFKVEESKASDDKIKVPVLFSMNNKIDKFFDADALSADGRIVLEVEAGRAYSNNQFLKDVFQACMMYGVDYLMIAVRNDYRGNPDFEKIFNFFETLYINGRLQLPLKGIVLIGY